MAKTKRPPIDDESLAMLVDQVKKGKPRKFVLVCKGADLRALTVFRKGGYDSQINKLKQAGIQGDCFRGVIVGSGLDLELQLPASADVSQAMKAGGTVYADEPCKTAKLRQFIQEQSGTKFKPVVTLVHELSQVAADDEEPTANSPNVTASESDVKDDEDATLKQSLLRALTKLKPLIESAAKSAPNRKQEIIATAVRIKSLINDDDLATAKPELLAFGNLLKELTAQPDASPNTTSTASEAAAEVPPLDHLSELKPAIKEAIQSHPGQKANIMDAVAKVKADITAENSTEAEQGLNDLRDLLSSLSDELGDAGQFELPNVSYSQAKQRWLAANEKVNSQIEQLQTAMRDSDHPTLQRVAEFGLNGVTGNLKVGVATGMLEYESSGQSPQASQKLMMAVRSLKTSLESAPVYSLLERNPLNLRLSIRRPLLEALNLLERAVS